MKKSKRIIVVASLLISMSLLLSLDAFAQLNISSYTPAATATPAGSYYYVVNNPIPSDNVTFVWDFSKGLDAKFAQDISNITFKEKGSSGKVSFDTSAGSTTSPAPGYGTGSTLIQNADFTYLKVGSGSDPIQYRRLTLKPTTVTFQPSKTYVVTLDNATTFQANNGNVLQHVYSFEFQTAALPETTTTTTIEPTTTTTSCPAPDLHAPSGTGVAPLPTFSWKKVDGVTWYNVAVYSGAANKYAATKWFDASLVCATDNCSAQLAAALYPGQYYWWLNTWSDGPCGFQVQPGGKYKQFTVAGCAGPTLSAPSGSVTFGTMPPHTFSTASAEWVQLQIYSSTLGAVSSQWADASTACTMGSCSVTPVRWIMALGQNWWWVNTYSTQCGYQFQPGGNLGSYIVQ